MNIKSLLVGSAAAFAAAVTGAKAADPIVIPEPEPMEYVRICDVYGAGFFYIPGTETCLKISGYVFYEIGATSDSGPSGIDPVTGDPVRLPTDDTPNYHGYNPNDGFTKYMRARVNFDARDETEWGTLQSYIRFQADYVNYRFGKGQGVGYSADPDVGLDQAWLSLGGFRVGYSESAFTATPNGGASGFGSHSWYGLAYGYSQRLFVQYNFTGANGFFATISLEEDDVAGVTPAVSWNYVPDVVGKVGITQGWGTAWIQAGWDEDNVHAGVAPAVSSSEVAVKGGVHFNMPSPGSSLRVIGFYASGINSYWATGEWSVLASYYHQFTPEFGASVGAQYVSDTNFGAAGDPSLWLAELNLVWTPVTNFEVRSEITYADDDRYDDGSLSGFVRFTRYFGDQ